MRKLTVALAALAIFALSSTADAQDRWAFEFRGSGATPTQDLGADELGTGFGFEGTLRYRFLPHLGAYAGWDYVHFSPDNSFAGAEMDFEETGYAFGLRFKHPFGQTGRRALWVRAGGTYDHIEIENSDGDMVGDSGHGMGWEVGGGLAFDVGSNWSLTPGVRYRSLSRDVEIGSATTEVELQYVAWELGLVRFF